VRLDFFSFFSLLKGRGVEVNFLFCFHLKCGRRTGKGLIFFFNFFSLWSG